MPIPSVNSPSLTVNAALVQQVLINGSINEQGKLVVSARAVLCGAQCTDPGTEQEQWTPAGTPLSVYIPNVGNLAGDPTTVDLAALQSQFDAAFSALVAAIAAVNQARQLV